MRLWVAIRPVGRKLRTTTIGQATIESSCDDARKLRVGEWPPDVPEPDSLYSSPTHKPDNRDAALA